MDQNPIPLTRRERLRRVSLLAGEGFSTRQIATILSLSQSRVSQMCRQHGIVLAKRGTRRYSTWVSANCGFVVDALANRAGISPSAMIDRIVRSVVSDGEEVAVRRLGKLARPVNSHSRGQQ